MHQQASIEDGPWGEAAAGQGSAEPEAMPKMALAEPVTIDKTLVGRPNIEPANIPAPAIAPDAEQARPAVGEADGESCGEETAASAESPRSVSRFALLAASLALAAGLGAMAGALAAATFLRPVPAITVAGAKTGLEEVQALKENIVQARVELAALKVSLDGSIRNASAQFTKLGERIERMERMQSEPVAKLGKAIETLERLARSESVAHATGSVASASAPTPPPAVVEGWVVREVQRGTALIEGRRGMIEVEKGDSVPGVGRVDAIRKQDGRWVVVTSKGLILSPH